MRPRKESRSPCRAIKRNKRVFSGYDTSPESFMNEALRVLIANKITPNMAVGYGSWVCDNFVAGTMTSTSLCTPAV